VTAADTRSSYRPIRVPESLGASSSSRRHQVCRAVISRRDSQPTHSRLGGFGDRNAMDTNSDATYRAAGGIYLG